MISITLNKLSHTNYINNKVVNKHNCVGIRHGFFLGTQEYCSMSIPGQALFHNQLAGIVKSK